MKDKITLTLMFLLVLLIVVFNQSEAKTTADSCFVTHVVSFTPGTTSSGALVENNNTIPVVTGSETGDASSFSLGIGGEIIVGFSTPVPVGADNDLFIDERDDNPNNEKVKVSVSASLEGPFTEVGEVTDNGFIDVTGFSAIKYVKLVDVTTNPSSSNGYDLDRIVSLHGCGTCSSATPSTARINDASEEQCLNSDAAITLSGEGPWKVGYTNGTGLAWTDAISTVSSIPLNLGSATWLTWVTDNNGCTTVISDSDTLTVAPEAEAYFRASYIEELTNNQQCTGGNGRLLPLILKGKSPWYVTYTLEQNGVATSAVRKVKKSQLKDGDTFYWRLEESGTYKLQSLEDDCGAGSIVSEIAVEGDTIVTDSLSLVDLATAQFADPDTVCNNSEGASLMVELTGTAPWQLTWEVEGVEYTQSDITASPFSIPLDLSGQYTLKSVRGAAECEGILLADSIADVLTLPTAQWFKKGGSICDPSEATALSVKLSGSAPFAFAYTINGVVEDTVITELETYDLTLTKPGTYQLAWVQNACGTGTVNSETIVEATNSTFNAISYETLSQSCNTASLLIQADSLSDDFEYEWYTNGKLVGQESSISFTEVIGRSMRVSLVTKSGQCTDTVNTVIPVEAIGTGDLGRFKYDAEGDLTCSGQYYVFRSDSMNSVFSYQWKIDGVVVSSESELSTQLESGLHSVQVIISDGSCQYSSQQQVVIPEADQSAFAEFSYTLSNATSCGAYPVTLKASTDDSKLMYRWLLDGEEVGQTANINYDLPAGDSEITLEITSGECTYTGSQIVTVEGETLLNAGTFDYEVESVNCYEQSFSGTALDEGEDLQYQWWLNGELIGEQKRITTNLTPGEYQLTLTTQIDGCRYEVEELLSVIPSEPLVNVPNVLSPQAVHADDQVVKVYGDCLSETGFVFQVLDRWGGIAYETTRVEQALSEGWDGGNHPSGVYTYTLRGQFDDGSVFQKQGKITLIK